MGQQAQPSGSGFSGGLYIKLSDGTYVPVVDSNGNLLAPVTTTDLSTTGNTTLGNGGADTTTIVSASANALTVGPNGSGNPVLQVDASTASVATGLKLKGAAAAGGFALSVISSGTNENLTIDAKGSGTITLASVSTGRVNINTSLVITTTAANGLIVGANGVTNPVFQVNANAASVATGLRVVGAAAASGVAVSALSSGTDEALTIDAKGAGLLTLNGTGTGNVKIGHGLTYSTQALSGAGAVDLVSVVTKITSTGANALTLADGVDGQVKVLTMVVDGGDATLTPTTKTGYSTIVFNDAGDGCTLVFTTTQGWIVVSNNGCTIS